jgi:hypothetical protein
MRDASGEETRIPKGNLVRIEVELGSGIRGDEK